VEGLSRRNEGEYFPLMGGGDRPRLELSATQEKLIHDVAQVNKRCVVVLIGGSAIGMSSWIDHVPSVLMAWYPGMQGGRAIAEILFGDENPSGRLPFSFPVSTTQIPGLDNISNRVTYDFWHDYRFYDIHGITPQFSFGHGLSYTSFEYGELSIDNNKVHSDDVVKLSFNLKNTGHRSGWETPQIYIGGDNSRQNPIVIKQLKAFKKVYLESGEQKKIIMEIPVNDCAFYDAGKKEWIVEKRDYKVFIGTSSSDIKLRSMFSVA